MEIQACSKEVANRKGASIEPPLCSDGNRVFRAQKGRNTQCFNRATAMQRWKWATVREIAPSKFDASIEPPLCSDGNFVVGGNTDL